ncbi:hypothetical protein [Oceanobacillus picturae]|uniref:hypothetical protein n=1 Tax=Oceanobacillus picturae TaxID=171693 RepID=UPI000E684BD2|nr:hypothetical protein [Oceanobacillus picturae]RIU93486.1 hypothetical protein D1864_08470 [Oceanobacillus picturae]
MKTNERKKWVAFFEKWRGIFIIVCTAIGASLGASLVYLFYGEFPYEVVVGSLVAAVILAVIEVIKKKRKKDNVPEADERVARNVFRFFAFTSHIFLAVLFIGMTLFTLLGNEEVPLLYLWIFFFLFIWISGIGAFIAKRR